MTNQEKTQAVLEAVRGANTHLQVIGNVYENPDKLNEMLT